MIRSLLLLLAFLATATSAPVTSRPAPIAVDFGSEYIKVAAVRPGTGSYHIVVDEQAKRKVPSVVAFETGERYFGNGATQFVVKRPKETYMFIHRLCGQSIDSPAVQEFRHQGFPYDIVPIEGRNTVGFKHTAGASDVVYTVEELLAMNLQHVIRISEADLEASVAGAVITVPNHWTQIERQCMLDAADLAGLNVFSLMNENTAAALQFGIDRKYDNETAPHTAMFYNMGASSTKVTIAQFVARAVKDGRKNRTEGSLDILATASDPTLGGQYFEAALTRFIGDHVNQQLQSKGIKSDVFTLPKPLAKIRLAAEKAKVVLSANSETHIHLASLLNDQDFKLKITREHFYELTKDLLARVAKPALEALSEAGLTKEELDSVTIVGGGTYMPSVQQTLKDLFEKPIGKSLNADDAMAMGAEFKSIEQSKQFKTRPFSVEDVTPYPVSVTLKDMVAIADAEPWTKSTSLFKRFNKLSKKKTLTLAHASDFTAELYFDANATAHLPSSIPATLIAYNVTGLTAAASNPKFSTLLETQKPRLSVVFLLDNSGMVSLASAEATLEETVQVPVVKKKKAAVVNVTADANSTETDSTDAANATETVDADAAAAEAVDEPEFTEKKVTHRIPITVTIIDDANVPHPMTFNDKRDARARLNYLKLQDQLKQAAALARNNLEAFIYATRAAVNEGKWDEVSTGEIRDSLFEALGAAEDWLYEQSADEAAAPFTEKLASLKALSEPIAARFSELTELPKAIASAQAVLNTTRAKLADFVANRSWLKAEDVEKLQNMTTEGAAWLEAKIAEQQQLSNIDDAILTSTMIYTQLAPIPELSERLAKIKKPAAPKPKVNKTKTAKKSKTENATDAETAETATETEEPVTVDETDATGAASSDEADSSNGGAGAADGEPIAEDIPASSSSHDDEL